MDLCIYTTEKKTGAHQPEKGKKKPRRLSDQSVSGSAPVFQLKSSFHHTKFIFGKEISP
jgi:hypothetical protein